MTATLIILSLSALLFVSGRLRSDLVAVCAALALVLCGILSPEEALSGFSNPIVIMMIGLFVVGGGIFSTGLAKMVGSKVLGLAGGSDTRLFVLLMLTTGVVGAFVSNTGTVALMMPIVVSMARAAGLPPSRFLMPLAFAGSMGGMLTLIGTPPNLVVRDAFIQAGGDADAIGFFTFTPIGIICFVVGIAVLLPLSKLFLSNTKVRNEKRSGGKTPDELAREYRLTDRVTLLKVEKNSPLIGKTVAEARVHEHYGVSVVEIRRTRRQHGLSKVEQAADTGVKIEENDVLCLTGRTDSVQLFAAEQLLRETGVPEKGLSFGIHDMGIAEILLMPGASICGRTLAELDFRKHYGLNVLGVRRQDTYLLKGLRDVRLHGADVVLVQGPWDTITRMGRNSNKWVVLGEPQKQARSVTLDHKAPIAAVILLLMVLAMAIDAIPIAPVTAVMIAAVLMIFTGCVRGVEAAYKTINWESIVLFGAMLPMSLALEKTGASTLISHSLVSACGDNGPYILLTAIYLATSLLTFFISNTVTAVLMAPIAVSAATAQGYASLPFLMAVAVAASMCFASPFSTPPNALVMSAGGYKPLDYVKTGLPLQIIMAVVMIIVLPLLFPFR